jgi:hypothetical protein
MEKHNEGVHYISKALAGKLKPYFSQKIPNVTVEKLAEKLVVLPLPEKKPYIMYKDEWSAPHNGVISSRAFASRESIDGLLEEHFVSLRNLGPAIMVRLEYPDGSGLLQALGYPSNGLEPVPVADKLPGGHKEIAMSDLPVSVLKSIHKNY